MSNIRYLITANLTLAAELEKLDLIPVNVVKSIKGPPIMTFNVTGCQTCDIETRFAGEFVISHELSLHFQGKEEENAR